MEPVPEASVWNSFTKLLLPGTLGSARTGRDYPSRRHRQRCTEDLGVSGRVDHSLHPRPKPGDCIRGDHVARLGCTTNADTCSYLWHRHSRLPISYPAAFARPLNRVSQDRESDEGED